MSPVREPSNHSFSYTGKFPSLKMKRMVSYESTLEKDLIYLLDFDQSVSFFEEQPLRIDYRADGKQRHYTPDFHAIVKGQDWLYECKPNRYVEKEDNVQKFEAARVWCRAQGWNFQVMTDDAIRSGYRLRNIKYLTSFARFIVAPDLCVEIASLLCLESSPIALDDFASKVKGFDRTRVLPAIFQMAFFHEIDMTVDSAPISTQTLVQFVSR